MGKIIVLSCDIADLQEALLQLQKVPIVVAPTIRNNLIVQKKPHRVPFTDLEKAEIMALHREGKNNSEIATILGVCRNQVRNFIYRTKQKERGKQSVETESPAFLTAMDYIKMGLAEGDSYLNIADHINRNMGGHWTASDVDKAIKEMNEK
jgi:DNA-binding NarL/FixJ family response regulator